MAAETIYVCEWAWGGQTGVIGACLRLEGAKRMAAKRIRLEGPNKGINVTRCYSVRNSPKPQRVATVRYNGAIKDAVWDDEG